MVVADDDALARVLGAHDVTCDGLRHDARIRESKILRDDAAPAIGSELDRGHECREKVYAMRTLCQKPDWPASRGADRLRW